MKNTLRVVEAAPRPRRSHKRRTAREAAILYMERAEAAGLSHVELTRRKAEALRADLEAFELLPGLTPKQRDDARAVAICLGRWEG